MQVCKLQLQFLDIYLLNYQLGDILIVQGLSYLLVYLLFLSIYPYRYPVFPVMFYIYCEILYKAECNPNYRSPVWLCLSVVKRVESIGVSMRADHTQSNI